ncbi:MAG: type II toxin-antitoxin system VapC family toxin [Candidatus Koribacter versatilis]|uniref:Ribonuclease VapC n=1 Tax=Candidatus Korobacter versatilis TaxID=658062 RepID=A0A932ENW8_9BACT|nr:type II toxin-antitoxin system VapC family toxin [Candidatus Koribacter versatilis]
MSGRYLLDSNIVIALFSGEPAVSEQLSAAEYSALSVIVYGELLAGALRSARVEDNVERLRRFARMVPLLCCDSSTAEEFASISVRLRRKGKPIPENDVWIAATARQHGLTLVSRDQHFAEVDDVTTVAW